MDNKFLKTGSNVKKMKTKNGCTNFLKRESCMKNDCKEKTKIRQKMNDQFF